MRSYSEIECRQTDPEAEESLVFDRFNETIEYVFVGKLAGGIWIKKYILGFIFKILVFTLSKGRDPTEAEIPEIADPKSLMKVVSLVSFSIF